MFTLIMFSRRRVMVIAIHSNAWHYFLEPSSPENHWNRTARAQRRNGKTAKQETENGRNGRDKHAMAIFQKFDLKKMGQAPGRLELSKGRLK